MTAWDESYYQTFGYRWKGEDTLTWGNPNEWVLINWLRNFFLNDPNCEKEVFIHQDAFWEILRNVRITKLEQIYTFRNKEKVRQFFEKHPPLISVLLEAKSVLSIYFGANIHVTLEIVSDPDVPDFNRMFGYIGTGGLSPDVAFERLAAMDNAWFLKQVDNIGDLFNFNLE
ncbi:MAG: hypothetical protein C0410_12070 [Anaerolinea sp.]|nr:hypothetical protein [Anaerolinea sp.]